MHAGQGRRSAADVASYAAIIGLLGVLAALVPLLIAAHYGALSIPRSDDWSYLKTLFTWRHTGRWDFNHWVSMTLVGQLVIARAVTGVLGDNVAALRVLVAAMGVGGLAAVVATARAMGLSRGEGLLVALSIALCPLWGPLAPTFMTDVPAFAFQMLSVALGCWGVRRGASLRWCAGALIASFIALTIRQYAVVTALAIVLAFAVAAWRDGDRRRLIGVIAQGALFAVAALAVLAWWNHIPNARSFTPTKPTGASYKHAVVDAGGFLRIAGLMMLPAIAWARPVAIARRAWLRSKGWTVGLVGAAAGLLVWAYELTPKKPFVGNYFDRLGVLSDDIINGQRPAIMPPAWFNVLVVLGSLAALVIVCAMVPVIADRWRRVRPSAWRDVDITVLLLAAMVVGYAIAYEIAILGNLPIFDRYALPALPPIGLLMLRHARVHAGERDPAVAVAPAQASTSVADDERVGTTGHARDRAAVAATAVALMLIAGLGFVFTAESASYDGARWQAAEAAVHLGYPVADVNGGYEWIGYQKALGRAPLLAPTPAEQYALRQKYYGGLCVDVVIDPPRPPKHYVARRFAIGFLRKPAGVYALRTTKPCAIPPPPGTPGR